MAKMKEAAKSQMLTYVGNVLANHSVLGVYAAGRPKKGPIR